MFIGDNLNDAIQEPRLASSDMSMNAMDMDMGTFFKEEFDIDMEEENYEKIDVPDFRGGRRGRFIHDFNANKTGNKSSNFVKSVLQNSYIYVLNIVKVMMI